jgi:hypothetical protein
VSFREPFPAAWGPTLGLEFRHCMLSGQYREREPSSVLSSGAQATCDPNLGPLLASIAIMVSRPAVRRPMVSAPAVATMEAAVKSGSALLHGRCIGLA